MRVGNVIDDSKATVSARAEGAAASVYLVQFELSRPSDNILREEGAHRLDLSVTPRLPNARACFADRWSPHRFERLGDLFLTPANEAIHARSEAGKQTSIVCMLNEAKVHEWLDSELEWTDRRLEASLDLANPSIRGLMMRMGAEARAPGFASEALLDMMAGQIAIELQRHCDAIKEAPAAGGLAPWRLHLIDERLTELRAPPTLQELADLCNLSVRQLTRGFRASRLCSIGDYIEQSRMQMAKHLLTCDESIKSIAHSMGFSSPSSFAFAFRRANGETPRQFRNREAAARR